MYIYVTEITEIIPILRRRVQRTTHKSQITSMNNIYRRQIRDS